MNYNKKNDVASLKIPYPIDGFVVSDFQQNSVNTWIIMMQKVRSTQSIYEE